MSNELEVKIKYFDKDVNGDPCYPLKKLSKGDWIDLHVVSAAVYRNGNEVNSASLEWCEGGVLDTLEYRFGELIVVKLGVAMKLPDGYEAHIAPRSSTFEKYGLLLTNSMGIIDNSYSGDDDEWLGKFYATRDGKITIGDRLLQFRLQKKMLNVTFTEVNKLEGPNRGGFGSTGR
ncbi:hypothetical protein phiCTP1_gp58 [Clostridium phage phiCTP1]|uniref:hypothetical protein n=1 Tax=Clostridium phage phiCTP1 TaxID=871584 RepID=UPI0001E0784B|nr:hypothetical protein phiCTP1_gp58 [Clostridium phage phiCTP1]ADL40359.1 hypothetical phage protein [Clostridium phage phiCTP1]WMU07990.1 hypothetical protein vBCtySFA88_00058 [Clostridium phage vB_CtyS-FA88]